jgi:hypothetical protein
MEVYRFAAYYCCALIGLSLLEIVGEIMKEHTKPTFKKIPITNKNDDDANVTQTCE